MDTDAAPPAHLDLVVFGATGFTGRLVAEHLARRGEDALRWGIAGRDRGRLDDVAAQLGRPDLPVFVADAHDRASLDALVAATSVVVSTVGPYAVHGAELVAACAASGTDYVDLTGEPQFVRRSIDAHQAEAERSGARIVHSCGFDSVPSDVGVLVAQKAMRQRHGVHANDVRLRVRGAKGGASGGTITSLAEVLREAGEDPAVAEVITDPHSLLPAGERIGAHTPDRTRAELDPDLDVWVAPFVMEIINARTVRRSNALLGYPWGRDLRYDEAVVTGGGVAGRAAAEGIAAAMRATRAAMGAGPLRTLVARLLPDGGSGPGEQAREEGFFTLQVRAVHPHDRSLDVLVDVVGDRDPGYGSTSRMVGEAGLVLAAGECEVGGGVWTPASALGTPLRERLAAHAGVTFTVRD